MENVADDIWTKMEKEAPPPVCVWTEVFQRCIDKAKKAKAAWNQDGDIENLRTYAFALMQALEYADTELKSLYGHDILKEAIEKLQLLLEKDPDDHKAMCKLGIAHYIFLLDGHVPLYGDAHMKHFEEASKWLKAARTKLPGESTRFLCSITRFLPPEQCLFYHLEDENMAQPAAGIPQMKIYQQFIHEAKQAIEAWAKNNDDIMNLRNYAFALMRAAKYADQYITSRSRLFILEGAKEKLELYIEEKSDDHYAKYKLGMACFRILQGESKFTQYEDHNVELRRKAIELFKEAHTQLPYQSERMLSCMWEWNGSCAVYVMAQPAARSPQMGLYQQFINEANQAMLAWTQNNDDMMNLRNFAFTVMRAVKYADQNNMPYSYYSYLKEAIECLELYLKEKSDDHYAKYKLGMAYFRLLQEGVTSYGDCFEELFQKTIKCLKEAQTELPPASKAKRALSAMWGWLNSKQRIIYQNVFDSTAEGYETPAASAQVAPLPAAAPLAEALTSHDRLGELEQSNTALGQTPSESQDEALRVRADLENLLRESQDEVLRVRADFEDLLRKAQDEALLVRAVFEDQVKKVKDLLRESQDEVKNVKDLLRESQEEALRARADLEAHVKKANAYRKSHDSPILSSEGSEKFPAPRASVPVPSEGSVNLPNFQSWRFDDPSPVPAASVVAAALTHDRLEELERSNTAQAESIRDLEAKIKKLESALESRLIPAALEDRKSASGRTWSNRLFGCGGSTARLPRSQGRPQAKAG